MDDFDELRAAIIDRFDVYDLVELLDLTTEDLIDKFDILGDRLFRESIANALHNNT